MGSLCKGSLTLSDPSEKTSGGCLCFSTRIDGKMCLTSHVSLYLQARRMCINNKGFHTTLTGWKDGDCS